MSIKQRKEIWWIMFTTPQGKRIRQSSGTKIKSDAQKLHDLLKAQCWENEKIGTVESHYWQEAVVRWLKEKVADNKKSIEDDKRILHWLDPHLSDKTLNEISSKVVSDITYARQADGVANATVNRTLAVVRNVLNSARSWEWIDVVPFVKELKEPKIRVRWLSHNEADRLLNELPPHLEAMARFSLSTGLRESNVVNLRWGNVDLQRRCAWVYGDEAKGKRDIAVPLNSDAIEVIRNQVGKNTEFVFTYKGKKVTGCNNTAWKSALRRAEISNFRWHDLRHTWASWHVQAGTSLHALQELGGWSTIEMVQKYAHLSASNLASFAENISYLDTKLAQERKFKVAG